MKMLNESQIVATYGVGLRQLRAMRARGDGPKYIKVSGRIGESGGRILYPVVDFERWLESCPTGGGQVDLSAEAR